MIESKEGHVVTISSVMGVTGSAQMTDYCASKAAVIALNQSLRYELDNRYQTPKIRTSLICPGHVLTPMFETIQLPCSFFWNFLLPSLPPVDVVKRIITVLDEQHSQEVYLPFYVNFASYLNHMPSFVRDFAQWFTTADYAMKNFVKQSERRPLERPSDILPNKED